jgi:hypothetical protein
MILLGGTFDVVLLTFVPLLDEIEVSMKLLVCSEICVSTLKGQFSYLLLEILTAYSFPQLVWRFFFFETKLKSNVSSG